MRRPRAALGAAVLCALGVCALWVSSASAITLHACEETAAGATAQEYTSATCEAKGAGKFRTVPVAEGTLSAPTAVTNQVISATIAGSTVEVVCLSISGSGKGENVTIGELKTAFVKALKIKYFECSVAKPKGEGCVLKKAEPPIESPALRLTGIVEGTTVKAGLAGEGGGALLHFTLEGCKNAGLNGELFLTGEARALAGADPSLLEFTATSGSKVELAGSPASYTGDVRLFMEGTAKRLAFARP